MAFGQFDAATPGVVVSSGAVVPPQARVAPKTKPAPTPVVSVRSNPGMDVVAFNRDLAAAPTENRILLIGGKPFNPNTNENREIAARMTRDFNKAAEHGSRGILAELGFIGT